MDACARHVNDVEGRRLAGSCTRSSPIGSTCRAGGCTISTSGRRDSTDFGRDAALRARQSDVVVSLARIDQVAAAALSLRGAGPSGLRPERQAAATDCAGRPHRQSHYASSNGSTCTTSHWSLKIGVAQSASARLLRMPERFERIVLFNTGAFPPAYIPWRIRACRMPILGRLAVQGGSLFSRAALRMTLARRRRLDPAVAAGYLAPYDSWANRRAVYGFVKDIPSGPHHPTWQTLADIERRLPTLADRPALLVWGMRDWCFRPDCLERFERAWPQAEVHRLADVGHWVVEDAPEEVVPLVETVLGRDRFAVADVDGRYDMQWEPNAMAESYRVRIAKAEHVFSAAHFITFDGQCERLHGHNYHVAAEIFGPLNEDHLVVDFLAVRDELREIVAEARPLRAAADRTSRSCRVDGRGRPGDRHFDDRRWVFPRGDCRLLPVANTTAELLAAYIGRQLKLALDDPLRPRRCPRSASNSTSATASWRSGSGNRR